MNVYQLACSSGLAAHEEYHGAGFLEDFVISSNTYFTFLVILTWPMICDRIYNVLFPMTLPQSRIQGEWPGNEDYVNTVPMTSE